MSEEITQIVFELPKWNKKTEEIKDDIDKLIHVMKMTHTLTIEEAFTPPEFWSEEWIDNAIQALKYANMTPDEREVAERMIVKAVHHVEVNEDRKRAIKRANQAEKNAEKSKLQTTNIIINLLKIMTPEQVVQTAGNISLEEVLSIKEQLNAEN